MTSILINALPLRFDGPDSVEVTDDAARILTGIGWTAPQEEGAQSSEFSGGGILPAWTPPDTGKVRVHPGSGGPWPPGEVAP